MCLAGLTISIRVRQMTGAVLIALAAGQLVGVCPPGSLTGLR
jgi:hypothetical protein